MRDKISNDKINTKKPCNIAKNIGNMASLQYNNPQTGLPSGNNTVIQCMRILNAGTLATNIVNDSGNRKPYNSQAHHIIPNELVVKGLDAVTQGLIGGSFTKVSQFFDESWNGVFLGTSRNIDQLPMHSTNHPEYTMAVEKYIGDNMESLVTDASYAKSIAEVFREQLYIYYSGGVTDISTTSENRAMGVNRYYQDLAFDYLMRIYNGLKGAADAYLDLSYFRDRVDWIAEHGCNSESDEDFLN